MQFVILDATVFSQSETVSHTIVYKDFLHEERLKKLENSFIPKHWHGPKTQILLSVLSVLKSLFFCLVHIFWDYFMDNQHLRQVFNSESHLHFPAW